MKPSQFVCINGSPAGNDGNSARICSILHSLCPATHLQTVTLASESRASHELVPILRAAHGFFFVSGTYWDSWGSPLQRFFEDLTDYELSDVWMGKPAAVIITMHSVGGKSILSRLQGLLSCLGCLIPPCSGMAYSLVGQLALETGAESATNDIWCLEDLAVVTHNIKAACNHNPHSTWRAWPVERARTTNVWIKSDV